MKARDRTAARQISASLLAGLLLAGLFCASCSASLIPPLSPTLATTRARTSLGGPWRFSRLDDPRAADPSFDDSGWAAVSFPAPAFPFGVPSGSVLWLRRAFAVDPSMAGASPGLVLGRLPDAVQVFINGSLIEQSGSFPPDPVYCAPGIPRAVTVPSALLRPGRANVLAYRVLALSEGGSFPAPYFCGNNDRLMSYLLAYIATPAVGIVGTVLALCAALYFLALSLRLRRASMNAWLAAGFALLSATFARVYVEYLGIPYLLALKLESAPLYPAMAAFAVYFRLAFGTGGKTWMPASLCLAGLSCAALAALSPDVRSFELLTGRILPPAYLCPLVAYLLWLSAWGMRRGLPSAPLCFSGALCLALAGGRDAAYALLGRDPGVWILNWGAAAFILSVFFASALRVVDVTREASERRAEAEARAEELHGILADLRGIGEIVARSGRELDAEIVRASESVKALIGSGLDVDSGLMEQARIVDDSGRTIAEVIATVEEAALEAEGQAAGIAEAGQAIIEVMRSIDLIGETSESATGIAARLAETARTGRSLADDSAQAIGDIERASGEVRGIVRGIRELSDRTKVLAMNAAIEAAHAGGAGSGFAVVADEVRALSERSLENAQAIAERMDEMERAIASGVGLFGRLASGFQDILEGAERTSDLVLRISRAAGDQSMGAATISVSMESLVAASRRLKDRSERQRLDGEALRSSLEGLGTASGAITRIMGSRSDSEIEMVSLIEQVRRISGENAGALAKLERISLSRN